MDIGRSGDRGHGGPQRRSAPAGEPRQGDPASAARRVTDQVTDRAPIRKARFFRNYNRTIGTAYAALLVGVTGFFAWQLKQAYQDELLFIGGQLERHGQFLEFVLRSSADQIESLRLVAGAEHDSGRACREGRRLALSGELREEGGQFHRDGLRQPDAGGNLVGAGPLKGREDDFYCSLGSALAVSGQLQALAFHLPNAARVRFLGRDGFHLVYPWQPSARVPFSPQQYQDPVWTQAQPAANTDRRKFWAPPFFGGEDVGLLAPVAVPVYGGSQLLGALAIDLSLDYLHRVNSSLGYPLGQVAVVDDRGRLIAHPQVYADPMTVRAAALLEQTVPQALLPTVQALMALAPREPVSGAGFIVVRRPFVSAPWQLLYTVPTTTIWRKLLAERAPGMAAALVTIASIMAVTYGVTRREFVGPAARLVNHVAAESSLRPQPIPKVPEAWRPWFEAISRAFGESLQLGSLRRELDIAARLQQAILPRQWPEHPGYTLWGLMQPAKDIGGDFYDHFALVDGRRGLVVADVSGKGVSAGLFGMVSKTALRSQATHRLLGPAATLADVNEALCADNESAMFVTAFYAQYDPDSGELWYANAGHPPPLLVRQGGDIEWLPRAEGPALGVVEGACYRDRLIVLKPGDLLLVYTDGVTEAMDAQGAEFGFHRLADQWARPVLGSSRGAVERVQAAVHAFAAGVEQADDITCVALCRQAAGMTEAG
jgi:sigma-B regulation protein RsbU (phosphoserine phosphatase)